MSPTGRFNQNPGNSFLLHSEKINLPSKCPRMPPVALSGLLQPFSTQDDVSLLSPLSVMDLLASSVPSLDDWPALIATACSVSVAVNSYSYKYPLALSCSQTYTHNWSSVTVASYIRYCYLHRKHLYREGRGKSVFFFFLSQLCRHSRHQSPRWFGHCQK